MKSKREQRRESIVEVILLNIVLHLMGIEYLTWEASERNPQKRTRLWKRYAYDQYRWPYFLKQEM